MGGKGSTTVEAPDPLEIARTDTAFNRIDQFTPTGDLTFSDRPGGPAGANNVATLNLPPELQQLFDSQTQSDQQLLNLALGRQEGFEGGLPDLIQGLEGDGDFDRGRFEDAIFDRGSTLLNRQFDRQEGRLRQDLSNRGVLGPDPSGEIGEAASTELGLFNQNRDEAFTQLSLQSILAGGQEGRQDEAADIGRQLTNANIGTSNRATQFNELASLLGLQQVAQPGLANFFTPGQADVTGAFALNNQVNIANANNAQSQRNSMLNGLFSLGAAAIPGLR